MHKKENLQGRPIKVTHRHVPKHDIWY